MNATTCRLKDSAINARLHSVGMAACILFMLAASGYGQVSPEEHAKHHPGQGTKKDKGGPPGMATDGEGAAKGMGGGMEGMEKMMEGMGKAPPKELYPSLMGLPELSPEKRLEVETQARERMNSGAALLSSAVESLVEAAQREDYAAMQEATAQMRQGLAQFESGLAAQRALAEGTSPQNLALHWFKHEMNLLTPGSDQPRGFRLWGMNAFHALIMGTLVAFAGTMIGMYFFKMRRATILLHDLTGGAPTARSPSAAPPTAPAGMSPVPAEQLSPPAAAPAIKKWSGKLRVGRIFPETLDVKTFRLMNPLGGPLPFSYLPGQFLTITIAADGKSIKRSYTIASAPTQHDYVEITVKHEAGGEVSGFLHACVQPGDLLEFSGPAGSFIFTGRECKCILLIGGGVGITPLMSVLRYLTDRSWPGDIFLIYGCHSPHDIIFREELDYLQRRHANLRVVIAISHSDGTDWKAPTGRIDKDLIMRSVPDLAARYVHLCGPVPMMESVKKCLAELGVPKERIKTEAFGLALGKPEATRPAAALPAAVPAEERIPGVAVSTVTFSLSDKSAPLPSDKAILDVADEIGVEIDNSCRVGTCGTCRVKLLSGHVTMAVEDGLEPGDKEQGIILACQAKSTDNVTVEA